MPETKETDANDSTAPSKPRKSVAFWLIFLSINISLFLSALELTAVSTALPTIAHDLNGTDFVWVGSAYALSSTAFVPMSGGLAQIFGRRPALLLCLGLFLLGSAICGAAKNMSMLIAGRTIQGSGGGGLQSMSYIILADLVTLQERGVYAAAFSLTWSLASTIGPVVAGSLVSRGAWRWLFYLNLPIIGLAAALVSVFLRLATPAGTIREKLARLDWFGNLIVIASTSACTIAITWGGITAPWGSVKVLVPLILGLCGLVLFIIYEAIWAIEPLVPFSVMANRTSLSGYFQTFAVGFAALGVIYFYPVFFQGCKDASPAASGVLGLGLAVSTVFALIVGIIVKKTGHYRPQMWLGWCVLMVGLGLLSTLSADDSRAKGVGFLIITSIGLGFGYATIMFPILAPLPVSSNAHALAFMTFLRSFAGIWGITVGSTVLQNELKKHLPVEFVSRFPQGVSIAYAAIPDVPFLPEPLKSEVQAAYAKGLSTLWQVLLGIAALGLLTSCLMRGLPLHTSVDRTWQLQEKAANVAVPDLETDQKGNDQDVG